MKVLLIMEFGIPEYRNFLFERLCQEEEITDLLVLHNGLKYKGEGQYKSKKLRFIGTYKLGIHLGVLPYIYKYDVIISSYNLRILSCWWPMFFTKKWILWGKGLGSNDNRVINFLRGITAKKASKILVYNDYKKNEFIEKIKISSDKIVAYNNTIKVTNPGFDITIQKDHFLYFGRIQKRKGLDILIDQYNLYVKNCENSNLLKLRFVGDGEYKQELIKKVNKLELQNLIEFFPGVYDDDLIKKHFEQAKAYVSPYNVGLGVVNSFAYGVPVLTTKRYQVGPEFHYLNANNSFVLESEESMNQVFTQISNTDLQDVFSYCFNFYRNNLSEDIMYNNFYKSILSLK